VLRRTALIVIRSSHRAAQRALHGRGDFERAADATILIEEAAIETRTSTTFARSSIQAGALNDAIDDLGGARQRRAQRLVLRAPRPRPRDGRRSARFGGLALRGDALLEDVWASVSRALVSLGDSRALVQVEAVALEPHEHYHGDPRASTHRRQGADARRAIAAARSWRATREGLASF
jgi:hypothetical protein